MPVGVTPVLEWARKHARIENEYLREVIGEFLASFLFCLLAVGGTCNLNAMNTFPSMGVSLGFEYFPTQSVFPVAFAYFIVILIFGGVSGAHVNPAISIGIAITGRLSWVKLHAFILVQFIGGYLGSLLAFGLFKNYFDALILASGSPLKLSDVSKAAALFNAAPGFISVGSGFANEIVLTSIFMVGVLSVKDLLNSRSPRYIQGFLIALIVMGLGLSFGQTTGVAINPIRDICPRLAALSLGFNSDEVMRSVGRQWWSVGLFGPFFGAILGSVIYIFVIGSQIRDSDADDGELITVQGNPSGTREDWKATVFIPKLQRAHTPNQGSTVNPYARVQFQQHQ